jgi:hypothetical protein
MPHDGLTRPTAFQRGMLVLAPTMPVEEAEATCVLLEMLLANVDPEASWSPEEAWMRAHGGRN